MTPCLLGWRKPHSPPAPTKLAKIQKETCSHQHAYNNTGVITGLISNFTENPDPLPLPLQHRLGSWLQNTPYSVRLHMKLWWLSWTASNFGHSPHVGGQGSTKAVL